MAVEANGMARRPGDGAQPGERADERIGAAALRAAEERPALFCALLFVLALALFLPGQASLPVTDRDEARFAQASKQMLESGDFVDIRFQTEARHNKPAGAYWVQAAAAALRGGPDAPISAYRLPSLIAAAGAVALTFWAARPLIGAGGGALAALFLATCVLLNAEARLAKTDALLLCSIVAAMGALARVQFPPPAAPGARPFAWVWPFWAAVGVGVLIKGPIILIPVVGATGALALARRSWAPVSALRILPGLAIVALIAGPWLVAITLKSGFGFWEASVGRDLLAKAAGGRESHGAPPGYHTLVAFVAFWPWMALAPFVAVWAWGKRRTPEAAFLLGWLGLVWLVFEATPTKLPHYPLPGYPALAMLLAWGLLERWRLFGGVEGAGEAPVAPSRPARIAAVAVWALPAAALAGVATLAPAILTGTPSLPAAALGAASAAAAFFAGRALLRWRLGSFAAAAAAASALGATAVIAFALPAATPAFPAPRVAEATARLVCPQGPVAITGYREPSVVFHLGTNTLMTDGAGAAEALRFGAAGAAWVGARERAAFDAAMPDAAPLGSVEGINVSNGRKVDLALFAAPGRAGPCGG